MMFRLLLALLSIACLTTQATAKPRSTQADTALAECKWTAEVQIKRVSPAPGKGWAPTIEVRLTAKAKGVFFGQKPSAKLSVHPLDASHDGTTEDLKTLIATGESVLMVVNENDQIVMVGKKERNKYLLRSWYDYNAWWIYASDKKFGKRVENPTSPMSTLRVSAIEIKALMAKRKKAKSPEKSR